MLCIIRLPDSAQVISVTASVMTVRIFDHGQLVYLHIYVLEDSDDVVMAMRLID